MDVVYSKFVLLSPTDRNNNTDHIENQPIVSYPYLYFTRNFRKIRPNVFESRSDSREQTDRQTE